MGEIHPFLDGIMSGCSWCFSLLQTCSREKVEAQGAAPGEPPGEGFTLHQPDRSCDSLVASGSSSGHDLPPYTRQS